MVRCVQNFDLEKNSVCQMPIYEVYNDEYLFCQDTVDMVVRVILVKISEILIRFTCLHKALNPLIYILSHNEFRSFIFRWFKKVDQDLPLNWSAMEVPSLNLFPNPSQLSSRHSSTLKNYQEESEHLPNVLGVDRHSHIRRPRQTF